MKRKVASVLSVLADIVALAAAAAIVSTGAFADDISVDQTWFVSTLGRAEVRIEVTKHIREVGAASTDWAFQYNPLQPLVRTDE